MSMPFEAMFSAYLALKLSAFENVKLVVAVLSEKGEECHALEAKLSLDSQAPKPAYLVRWKNHFIHCGNTNAYTVGITELANIEAIDAASIRVLQVPVLSLQQVSFMCMENAHFDHC